MIRTALLLLAICSTAAAGNATLVRFHHYFADELGRWNACKPFVVRTPLDFSYLDDKRQFFKQHFGLEVGEEFDEAELRVLYSVFASLPPWHVVGLARIRLQEDCGPDWRGYYLDATHDLTLCESGFRDPDGLVASCPGGIARKLYVILHEIGHHVWSVLPETEQQRFSAIVQISELENFARFYANFILYNHDLQKQSREIWSFYNRSIFK